MTSAQIGDVRIEYVVDGPDDGEPMLLIMGMGAQLVAWPQDLVDLLVDRGFRVVRYDNRDQGLSSFTETPAPSRKDVARGIAARRFARADYTLADLAGDAAGLLEHLGIESAHVVGASMGGMIAQQLTIDRPELVRSLCSIMSNTGHRRYGRTSTKLLPALVRQIRADPPTTREEALAASVEAFRVIAGKDFDADEMRLIAQAHAERGAVTSVSRDRQLNAINASPDRTAALRRITVPTLVIHGLRDRLVLPSGGVATARAIRGSRLLVFPEMGHDLPRGRRVEMADAIALNASRADLVATRGERDRAEVEEVVEAFFAAFATGPGLDERMRGLRDLFLPGASVVATRGGDAADGDVRSWDVDEFIEPRRALLAEGGPLEEFREWPTGGRVEVFGDVAHWFGPYAKAGVDHGEPVTGRGAKSIQLVRERGAWRISAVAWHDA